MISKNIVTLILIMMGFTSFGQIATNAQSSSNSSDDLKELTLEDAIIKRFSHFYPKGVSGLKWFGDQLVQNSEDKKSIISYAFKDQKPVTILNLEDLNEEFGKEWQAIPRISWSDNGNLYFVKGQQYYNYNLQSKSGIELFDFPEGAQNTKFSSVSKAVAYTIDNNLYISNGAEDKLSVTNNVDKNIVAGQAIARYEMGITQGIFWSPKTSAVAFYQKDESLVTDYPLVDITTTPATLTNTKYPMAGQGSEYAQVGVYNLITKKTIYLNTDGEERDQYLTNLTWGPNGQYIYIAIVNRGQDHVWLNKYDATTGEKVKTLFEEKDSRYVEPENDLYFIPGKNNEFLWFSERDGFNHLYRYNTDGKLLNQVTKGKWVVLKILGMDSRRKKLIIKGTDESGINQIAYCSSLNNSRSERIDKDAKGIHRYQLNKSGNKLIDDFTTLNNPRSISLITTKAKLVDEILVADDPLAGYKMGKIELVNFTSKAGVNLHGRIIKPSFFDPTKKYPVFVYLYGGPHAQMVTNRWLGGAPLWMIHMAERGYVVFTMDNRGSANRGNEFESVVHRQLGTLEMEDQLAGVDYLKQLSYTDTDNMAIHGWSFGGFMASTMMLRAPGVFDIGIAGGPVTDWKYYEVMYGERYMDTPEDNPEGYKTSALKNYVDNLVGDLLIIHGSIDPTVVPQHSLDLMKSFVEQEVQMDFYTYPMHPHNVRGKDRVHLMRKVLNYVDDKMALNKMKVNKD